MSNLIISMVLSVICSMPVFASDQLTKGVLTLSFSDGRPDVHGVSNVNKELEKLGVIVTKVDIPTEAHLFIEEAKIRALSAGEKSKLLEIFSLRRVELLNQIKLAGRAPAVPLGGFLATSEPNVEPYPKVYDMKSMSNDVKHFLQHKFGKLHVNSSNEGQGIDEVMTIISGGKWTWFFVLEDGVVGKLTLGYVDKLESAWRISYPGLVPHGGFFDAEYGLVIAHAHGPKYFIMRYEDASVKWPERLGGNPWVDFTGEVPLLLSPNVRL